MTQNKTYLKLEQKEFFKQWKNYDHQASITRIGSLNVTPLQPNSLTGSRGVFWIPSYICNGTFCKNNERLKTFNYFCKEFNIDAWHGPEYVFVFSRIIFSMCLKVHRRAKKNLLWKILKSIKVTRKHSWQSPSSAELQACSFHLHSKKTFLELNEIFQNNFFSVSTLNKKCPYSVLFWSVFSRIRAKYGEINYLSVFSTNAKKCRPE